MQKEKQITGVDIEEFSLDNNYMSYVWDIKICKSVNL